MDIISHGLWGGVAFGRKSKKLFWWSFGFGVLPDFLSFGIFTIANILGLAARPNWGYGLPDPAMIPLYVHTLYNLTHSLFVFFCIFGLVWLLLKKPFLPMLAWCLHILVDIPTHSVAFFPTPFLWPVSNFVVDGVSWGHPIIFFPDVVLLVICYSLWWFNKKKKKGS